MMVVALPSSLGERYKKGLVLKVSFLGGKWFGMSVLQVGERGFHGHSPYGNTTLLRCFHLQFKGTFLAVLVHNPLLLA